MSNVQVIKFTNGEEILADVIKILDDRINISNPIRILIMPVQGMAQPKIGFGEWIPYVDAKEFTIWRKDILMNEKAIPQFVEEYERMFSKIITTAGTQKLILPT